MALQLEFLKEKGKRGREIERGREERERGTKIQREDGRRRMIDYSFLK